MHVPLSSIPTGALVVLGVLAVAEVVLDVIALVDLYRRPAASVTLPSKWIWVAIIVLVNLLGAILYFAIGRIRTPNVTDGTQSAPTRSRSAAEIADSLYGKDGTPKP
jgi:hypothetical protein